MENHFLDSTYLMIGNRRQFFFDDLLIEQFQDLTRRTHAPEKVSSDPLIRSDQPWEHVTYFTCNAWNVIRDPADDLFKCWYEDWMVADPSEAPTWINESDGKFCVDFHAKWPTRLCYAQSRDGIHWEKPAFDYVQENGSRTNIVLGNEQSGLVHCAYVFLDMADPDPSRRYKAIFENRRSMGGNDMAGEGGFRAASSEDGIHWEIWNQPIRYGRCGEVLGDVITVSRDPESGIYWANNRHPRMCSSSVQDRRQPVQPSWIPPSRPNDRVRENRRRVFRSESMDLCTWSSPEPLVVPDSLWDNMDDAFYGMEQFQVGEDWVGLLNVFHMTDNTMDVQLTHSRNGRRFQRIQPGRAWLPTSGKEAWDRTMVNICSKPIVVGDELYVYYGGAPIHHDWWVVGAKEGLDVPEARDMGLVDYGLGLAVMKKDRFVSLSGAEAREGLLVTPPVHTTGSRLMVNARTRPGGMVRVAVADGQNQVYEGFDKEQCIGFSGDSVEHEIRWKGRNALPSGPFKKLHFYLKNADLFSFQCVD